MTVDIISISSLDCKVSAVTLANEVNDKTLSLDPASLRPVTTANPMQSLLMDPVVRLGILINKVRLENLFPSPIDIRSFEKSTGSQLPPFNKGQAEVVGDVASFNAKHGAELLNPEHDILNNPTSYPKEVVKDFVQFCRVTGFFDLSIADVILSKYDGVLHITVVDTHTLYTGKLEVFV